MAPCRAGPSLDSFPPHQFALDSRLKTLLPETRWRFYRPQTSSATDLLGHRPPHLAQAAQQGEQPLRLLELPEDRADEDETLT